MNEDVEHKEMNEDVEHKEVNSVGTKTDAIFTCRVNEANKEIIQSIDTWIK